MNDEPRVLAKLSELNALWFQLARAGDFVAAWKVGDEALALRAAIDCSRWPRHHQFLWRGQPLEGRRVLVRCYHGLGDTIQFVRFLPRVRAIAREVILWAQPTLLPLLRQQRGGAHRLLPLHEGDPGVECEVTIELAEVMHVLRVDPNLIQVESPYLSASRVAGLVPSQRYRVGVVWRAGEWCPERSVPCELLSGLQQIPEIEWVVLQRGPALAQWAHGFGRIPHIEGILDEARVMRELDLLISVDTCSAHLAGALGVPVWTLLPYEADWRWMQARTDTPWYPTMRLFRQRRAGEWAEVLDEVLEALQGRLMSTSLRLSR
ncbi:MAG TPA: hypothetical protein VMF89_13050 [Polyangiales bacterium]|nr:hypothetical protein [Polyangiales bacterium]